MKYSNLFAPVLVTLFSVGAFAGKSPSCDFVCKENGTTGYQESESLDECVDFVARAGCEKVMFNYQGDDGIRTSFISVVSGEISFGPKKHQVKMDYTTLDSTTHQDGRKLSRKDRLALMDSPSRHYDCCSERPSSTCQLTCREGINITRDYPVSDLDSCIDLAGQIGCARVGYSYSSDDSHSTTVTQTGELEFKKNAFSARVKKTKVESSNATLEEVVRKVALRQEYEANFRNWAAAPDPFGMRAMEAGSRLMSIGR